MKKTVKTLFIAGMVMLAMAACKKGEASCQRVDYTIDGVDVTTYQWMTQEEAEATFSKYQNVRISHLEEAEVDCLTHNFEE